MGNRRVQQGSLVMSNGVCMYSVYHAHLAHFNYANEVDGSTQHSRAERAWKPLASGLAERREAIWYTSGKNLCDGTCLNSFESMDTTPTTPNCTISRVLANEVC